VHADTSPRQGPLLWIAVFAFTMFEWKTDHFKLDVVPGPMRISLSKFNTAFPQISFLEGIFLSARQQLTLFTRYKGIFASALKALLIFSKVSAFFLAPLLFNVRLMLGTKLLLAVITHISAGQVLSSLIYLRRIT